MVSPTGGGNSQPINPKLPSSSETNPTPSHSQEASEALVLAQKISQGADALLSKSPLTIQDLKNFLEQFDEYSSQLKSLSQEPNLPSKVKQELETAAGTLNLANARMQLWIDSNSPPSTKEILNTWFPTVGRVQSTLDYVHDQLNQ